MRRIGRRGQNGDSAAAMRGHHVRRPSCKGYGAAVQGRTPFIGEPDYAGGMPAETAWLPYDGETVRLLERNAAGIPCEPDFE
jgi:hypothetical protein